MVRPIMAGQRMKTSRNLSFSMSTLRVDVPPASFLEGRDTLGSFCCGVGITLSLDEVGVDKSGEDGVTGNARVGRDFCRGILGSLVWGWLPTS